MDFQKIISDNITVFDPKTGEVLEAKIHVDEDKFLDQLIQLLQLRRVRKQEEILLKKAEVACRTTATRLKYNPPEPSEKHRVFCDDGSDNQLPMF